jgi:uncharacterized membrane protein YdbT with pleckstrin-like domain
MSYAAKHLIPGEKILYETRLHWIVLVWHAFLAILFLVVPGVLLIYYNEVRDLGYILIVSASIPISIGIIRRNGTEMALTDKRLLIKQGVFSRTTLELLLSQVESIVVEEPVFGRIMHYGTVIVRGTGGTPEPFPKVARPLEFRQHVEQQIEVARKSMFQPDSAR